MDIRARTSHWSEGQLELLRRERHYAVATITKLPFAKADQLLQLNEKEEVLKDRLCNACTQIIVVVGGLITQAMAAGRMKPQIVAMDYTLSELQVSARVGCHLCSILEASLLRFIKNGELSALEFEEEKVEDSWLYLKIAPSRMEEVLCALTMGLVNAKVMTDAGRQVNFCSSGDFDRRNRDEMGPLGQISYNTGHDSTFEIVASLLKACREMHELCKQSRPPESNVPRRLLQLDETSVRVVDNTTQLQYACLSHCWGSQTNVPHRLTNGDQYGAFEVSSLPKTFRDAIEIAKRLGVKHIWIDCFCIVQESEDDWIEQSAVMAQIYANSDFTIAALAAPNTHGGCFKERNPLALQPLRTATLTVEPHYLDSLWRLEVEGSPVESSPLHTRAWVVQERFSSPRTIYYGAYGVYWECRCMRASENHVKRVEDDTENTKTMLNKLQVAAEAAEQGYSLQADTEFLYRWQRLLEVYTVCSLTRFSDKLVALSGITRDIEKYSGKRYIQGLWRNDISTGLLWTCRFPFDRSTKVNSRRMIDSGFPSWSWASMLGAIQYFGASGKIIWRPQISVVDGSKDKCLQLISWKRGVSLDDEDGCLILINDGSLRGDLQESYSWYSDEKTPPGHLPMEIILIQRILTSAQPFLSAVKCLVVNCVSDDTYTRVGMATIRFDDPRDDPFPQGHPPAKSSAIVLI